VPGEAEFFLGHAQHGAGGGVGILETAIGSDDENAVETELE
jgi:hypothetical protein